MKKLTRLLLTLTILGTFNCVSIFTVKHGQMKKIKSISVLPILEDPNKSVTETEEYSVGGFSADQSISIPFSTFEYTLSTPSTKFKNVSKKVVTDPGAEERNALAVDIADAMSSTFLENNYRIVERAKLNSVLKEQKLQMTGLLEDDSVQIGKLAGANAILFIKVIRLSVKKVTRDRGDGPETRNSFSVKYSIKMVSTSTGEVVLIGKTIPSNDFQDSMEEFKFSLVQFISYSLNEELQKVKLK